MRECNSTDQVFHLYKRDCRSCPSATLVIFRFAAHFGEDDILSRAAAVLPNTNDFNRYGLRVRALEDRPGRATSFQA